MIDTHCHLTYDGLYERVDEVIRDAHAAGVDRMVSIGTTPEDAGRAAALAAREPSVYATAGVHPGHAHEVEDVSRMTAELAELLDHPRVVALGEMGLDWHYPDPPRDVQRRVFAAQLALMQKQSGLPGVIHNREATDDTLAMIAESGLPGGRFVFHCFTGGVGEVERILETGARVGFTGIVTFGSAGGVAAAADRVPLDRLMLETDSPFLTPVPHRKVRPNEPKFVPCVAAFLAERWGMAVEDLIAAADANAERFYRLAAVADAFDGAR